MHDTRFTYIVSRHDNWSERGICLRPTLILMEKIRSESGLGFLQQESSWGLKMRLLIPDLSPFPNLLIINLLNMLGTDRTGQKKNLTQSQAGK